MGRGAKIFLLSAFISTLVFGLISFVIVSSVIDRRESQKSFSLLAVGENTDGSLSSVVFAYSDNDGYVFMPIDAKTLEGNNPLNTTYLNYGVSGLLEKVCVITGITPEYYVVFDSTDVSESLRIAFASASASKTNPFNGYNTNFTDDTYNEYKNLIHAYTSESVTVLTPIGEYTEGYTEGGTIYNRYFITDYDKTRETLAPYIKSKS